MLDPATHLVIPGHRVAMSPELRGNRHIVGSWIPDRAPRVRNDENTEAL